MKLNIFTKQSIFLLAPEFVLAPFVYRLCLASDIVLFSFPFLCSKIFADFLRLLFLQCCAIHAGLGFYLGVNSRAIQLLVAPCASCWASVLLKSAQYCWKLAGFALYISFSTLILVFFTVTSAVLCTSHPCTTFLKIVSCPFFSCSVWRFVVRGTFQGTALCSCIALKTEP